MQYTVLLPMILHLILPLTLASPPSDIVQRGLPAFPGAMGFGAQSVGGRGGKMLFVTNLNDSGPGSLREALQNAEGPRIVIVKTSGVIDLSTKILISNPYVTLACQTAPGQGIVLRNAQITVGTHDVIIRGCRFRPADNPNQGEPSTTRDALTITSGYTNHDVYNVVIDHNSMSWAIDETMEIWTNRVHDITVSNNILSEALNNSIHQDETKWAWDPHSMGIIIGSQNGMDNPDRISIHHNLFMSIGDRVPLQRGYRVEFTNNVVHNWGTGPIKIFEDSETGHKDTIIQGNWFQSGPDTRLDAKERPIWIDDQIESGTVIYHEDNFHAKFNPSLSEENDMQWCSTSGEALTGCLEFVTQVRPSWQRVPASHPTQAYLEVLAGAGATSPSRDSIDTYIVQDVQNDKGKIVDCVDFCGYQDPQGRGTTGTNDVRIADPWAQYVTVAYPQDSDGDGIPDEWENRYGLDPDNTNDAEMYSPRGYQWIEEYINSFFGLNY